MKYRLKVGEVSGLKRTCACGKCDANIIISEEAKEEFIKLMGWDEEKFKEHTIEVDDED